VRDATVLLLSITELEHVVCMLQCLLARVERSIAVKCLDQLGKRALSHRLTPPQARPHSLHTFRQTDVVCCGCVRPLYFPPCITTDAKWIRALLKKLREIETIKLKKARGDALADSQVRALANCCQTRHPWPTVTNATLAWRVQYCTRCQA
jgi:hypothetical protein